MTKTKYTNNMKQQLVDEYCKLITTTRKDLTILDFSEEKNIPKSTFADWMVKYRKIELPKKDVKAKVTNKLNFGKVVKSVQKPLQTESTTVKEIPFEKERQTLLGIIKGQSNIIKELEAQNKKVMYENKEHNFREKNIDIMVKGLDQVLKDSDFAFNEFKDNLKKMSDLIRVWGLEQCK